MKIAIETLGCKLNQAETELLAGEYEKAGHQIVQNVEDADVYVLNTCTVTSTADSRARQMLRQARRRNAGAQIIATGCYAQRAPEELSRIDGVKLLTGKEAAERAAEALECCAYAGEAPAAGVREGERTRAMIKIQEGCDAFCTYCIVPLVRGRSRSVPADEVIAQIRQKAAEGFKEVVLTGTEPGAYAHEGAGLEELLARTLAETGVPRIRVSSLQPNEITGELLALWEDARLCPHFHLPLQSGSDSVLKRMSRRYTAVEYLAAVELIKGKLPDAAITTDIITGFPSETEGEFEESHRVCREAGFARMHVFPYSPRQGTAAANRAVNISNSDRTQRNQKLRALAAECRTGFIRGFSGRTVDVLWEKQSGGVWTGHTPNYIKVYARSGEDLNNRITAVRLVKAHKDGAWGEIHLDENPGQAL